MFAQITIFRLHMFRNNGCHVRLSYTVYFKVNMGETKLLRTFHLWILSEINIKIISYFLSQHTKIWGEMIHPHVR